MTETALAIRRFISLDGYFHGLTQHALTVSLAVSRSRPDDLAGRLDAALTESLGPGKNAGSDKTKMRGDRGLVQAFALGIQRILEEAGFPNIGPPGIKTQLQTGQNAVRNHLLVLPTLVPRATAVIARFLETLLESLQNDPARQALLETERVELDALRDRIRAAAPKGTNNHQFISAAHRLNIPCLPLSGGIFQYGWGSQARWMSSSVSDATPNLAARTARDKFAAGKILFQAGFPVPECELVRTEEAARAAADRIGYPVVVKPADQDGSVGVSVWLKTPDQVSEAFKRARKLSANVLVQKFITEPEHRLNLFRGRLIGANQRLPAGVTGDGETPISSLIEQANTHPDRKPQRYDGSPPLRLDADALELLAFQGFTPESIPPAGSFVRLSHGTRRQLGGSSSDVFERVHPDNAALAAEAAALLRLDIAGMDFLCEDISKSWKECSSVAITEINSAPEYGAVSEKLPEIVLRGLVRGEGRIPVILCLDMSAAAIMQLAKTLEEALAQGDLRLGVTMPGYLRDATGWRPYDRQSALSGARTLMMRPTLDAALIGVDFTEIKKNGLPLDRFDALVLNDQDVSGAMHQGETEAAEGLSPRADFALLGGVGLHLRGPTFLGTNHPQLPQIRMIMKDAPIRRVESVQNLTEELAGLCGERAQPGTA